MTLSAYVPRNALVLIDPSKLRIVGNSEATTTAVRRICCASGAKESLYPKCTQEAVMVPLSAFLAT